MISKNAAILQIIYYSNNYSITHKYLIKLNFYNEIEDYKKYNRIIIIKSIKF